MIPFFDVAVIGAGAAGMMAASIAGQRGLRVVLIDHAEKLAEKIRISGGGRCNFTNTGTSPENFLSKNPHFCRSALASYTPQDFLELVREYRIGFHEKHKGQLFCDDSSESIIQMLRQECLKGQVSWRMPCSVQSIGRTEEGFVLRTSQGDLNALQVVIATGGMAIPQLGSTDYALRVARHFGLKVIEPHPALVPLTFDGRDWKPFSALSGMALEVEVSTGQGKQRQAFLEDLLFTHRGLSGPGILQISSYWQSGQSIGVDLAPGQDIAQQLLDLKAGSRQQLLTVLSTLWPRRLVEQWLDTSDLLPKGVGQQRLADLPDRVLRAVGQVINAWELKPSGTAGYKKAEVMSGGVDTRELNQKSMEARKVPGLFFIGEAVDVTGWLGGYNFQWAWASAAACARALKVQAGQS
ncbi:NAD(P)/FAD-dependent oxidoreductase [Alcaligenes faecalis]|uniref:NAD(P)/FAD-dependent oxidoreductase n=2 Tax=Alcaligenes faecalis TaxID=511 RepID=UPI0029329FDB|nr:NAD(P)/FAD-dependent oxidoreductase [Alcaligenes faecalis]MDV2117522.1 NAD(P)/FAD-dependent oxidoreductase [Alcaligenes faecalis]